MHSVIVSIFLKGKVFDTLVEQAYEDAQREVRLCDDSPQPSGFATDKLITLEDGPGPHVYSYIAVVRDLNHPHALPIFTWENLEHTIVARRTVAQAAVHERENDQSRHWSNRMQASWTDFKKRKRMCTRLKNTGVEWHRYGSGS